MKIFKKLFKIYLVVMIICLMPISVSAERHNINSMNAVASSELIIYRNTNGNIEIGTQNKFIETRMPGMANIVGVYVHTIDKNKVRVSIQNIGLDWVDSVSMNVKIYNARGLQQNKNIMESSIKQFFPRNNDFYVVGWNRIVITDIVVKDEGDSINLSNIDYSK